MQDRARPTPSAGASVHMRQPVSKVILNQPCGRVHEQKQAQAYSSLHEHAKACKAYLPTLCTLVGKLSAFPVKYQQRKLSLASKDIVACFLSTCSQRDFRCIWAGHNIHLKNMFIHSHVCVHYSKIFIFWRENSNFQMVFTNKKC